MKHKAESNKDTGSWDEAGTAAAAAPRKQHAARGEERRVPSAARLETPGDRRARGHRPGGGTQEATVSKSDGIAS